ncbi:MAG: hypothetical protein PUE99_07615, partial [Anaerovibrio sp.]|nr:hypothetical protein [Anaerovibrio sp.]
IFRQAGFDVSMLGEKRIERATARWRAMYAANGMEALRGQVKANAKKKAAARTKKKAEADGREYGLQDVAGKLEELLADVELYESRVRQLEKVTMELTDRMKVLEKRSNELVIEKEVLCKARKIDRGLNNADGRNNTELYQLIREAVETCPEYANVTKLCESLNVSARGYYAYFKSQ